MRPSGFARSLRVLRVSARRLAWEGASAVLERARFSRSAALWRPLFLVLILARRRTPVFLFRGPAAAGGEVSLAVGGSAALAREVADAVYGEAPTAPRLVRRANLAGPRTLDHAADLEAARVHPWHAGRWAGAGWLVVPRRVRFELDLAAPGPRATGGRGRALRSDLKKVARAGFTFEEVPARQALAEFRSRMVVPYARERFGARAAPWIARAARRGTILFAVRDGVRVAGALLLPRGRVLSLVRVGVLNGRFDVVRDGVLAALKVREIAWARGRGFRALDAGLSSALTDDGGNRWKRKWGFVARDADLAGRIAFRARTDAGRRALASLAFFDGGERPS